MTQAFISDNEILENLDAALLLLDSDRIIRRVNISAETLFEQSRRYLLGKRITEVIQLESFQSFIDNCFEHNSQLTLREQRIELEHKTVIADITLSAIAGPKQAAGLLIEIGLINRLSKLMREQNQNERQQSLRLMIRGLAHEIKNPLGGIRGAAQLLEREVNNPNQKEMTHILIKETDRLSRLVDRVMGSREQLNISSTSIHQVLEHIVELVSLRTAESITVHRDYDPTLPDVNIDKEQMIQALLNIIINAIEAQRENDELELGLITQFVRAVTINSNLYKRVLMIQIWDKGAGVPDSIRDNLFDPLVTGRPDGTGLGLSITQEIVQRHEGSVHLHEYKGNTCFTVYLPYLNND